MTMQTIGVDRQVEVEIGSFCEAMNQGDWDAADEVLGRFGKAVPEALLEAAADLHMMLNRWGEASKLLNRILNAEGGTVLKQNLARNMRAAEKYRPELYEVLVNVEGESLYQPLVSEGGGVTLVRHEAGGGRLCLSPGNDPVVGLKRAIGEIEDELLKGEPIALLGLADGYLLEYLAGHGAGETRDLSVGQEQAIFVFEEDGHLVRACFMLHDYGKMGGALREERIRFYVGEGCMERFRDDLLSGWDVPLAQTNLTMGPSGERMRRRFLEIGREWIDKDQELTAEVKRIYEAREDADFAGALKGELGRKPRVMLLTSRFTTVLKYSTADAAAAFESLGWESLVVMEEASWKRHTRPGLRKSLIEFQPDMVFQIDHLRYETEDLFPECLPFVCWTQDFLPNLICDKASSSIGERDLVLTTAVETLVSRYGYPREQCYFLGRVTRLPVIPSTWAQDGEDVVFVSNASGTPEEAVSQTLDRLKGLPLAVEVYAEASKALIGRYEEGGFATKRELGEILDGALEKVGAALPDEKDRMRIIIQMAHPLNNLLYRQQAIRWAVNLSSEMDFRVGLYGKDWANSEEFGAFGRGVVGYGEELEALTRRSKVNLQIVPYLCLSHQRLLDGIAAGGFYLVREYPCDWSAPGMLSLIEDYGNGVEGLNEGRLRGALPDEKVEEYERYLLDLRLMVLGADDVVERVMEWGAAGLVSRREAMPVGIENQMFKDEAGLKLMLERWLGDDEGRREAALRQREGISRTRSYEAGLRGVMDEFLHRGGY